MELRWSVAAADDLERIANYLSEEAPGHAARIVTAIYEAPSRLCDFPGLGRPGRLKGTRELVLPSLPYVIVYVHSEQVIHIARILHGAQKWP